MHDTLCEKCGSTVFIVEYYNTGMDHETTLDVMSGEWIAGNKSSIQRVDCLKCDNMVIPPSKL